MRATDTDSQALSVLEADDGTPRTSCLPMALRRSLLPSKTLPRLRRSLRRKNNPDEPHVQAADCSRSRPGQGLRVEEASARHGQPTEPSTGVSNEMTRGVAGSRQARSGASPGRKLRIGDRADREDAPRDCAGVVMPTRALHKAAIDAYLLRL